MLDDVLTAEEAFKDDLTVGGVLLQAPLNVNSMAVMPKEKADPLPTSGAKTAARKGMTSTSISANGPNHEHETSNSLHATRMHGYAATASAPSAVAQRIRGHRLPSEDTADGGPVFCAGLSRGASIVRSMRAAGRMERRPT